MKRDQWQKTLERQELDLGYNDGFKLLFCPWRNLETADTLFISLNPGNDPSNEEMRIASDERGNSYLLKREAKHSPMALQYELLCKLIERDPEKLLVGALMAFRTDRWVTRRDTPNISVTLPFWKEVLTGKHIKRVYCMGRDVERQVVSIVGGRLAEEIPAGWGNLNIRRYVSNSGVEVFGLLHFSTYKMLSREECLIQLEQLFGHNAP